MRDGANGHEGYNAGDMRCRLFTILSVLSLALCVATAVLWVRSEFVFDQFC
jgi:hypothetical protein